VPGCFPCLFRSPVERLTIAGSARGVGLEALTPLPEVADYRTEQRQGSREVALFHPEARNVMTKRREPVVARKIVTESARRVLFRPGKILPGQFQIEEVVKYLTACNPQSALRC
jgi:hypothetical protein